MIATIMPPVNPIRVPASVTKDIRVASARILAQRATMVPSVWRNAVVRMVVLAIMYRVNVYVLPDLQDHCKLERVQKSTLRSVPRKRNPNLLSLNVLFL